MYCTIVRKKIIYQWILSDFSFDDGYGSRRLRHASAKNGLLPEKMQFENTKISTIYFFKS